MRITRLLVVLLSGATINGQLVVIGPPDPNYCEHFEHVEPNLKLTKSTHISGTVWDESGAPFENAVVEASEILC
jgi:hypothetical protein